MKTDYGARLEAIGVVCASDGAVDTAGSLFAYQCRAELIKLCEWIEKKEIRSYLELGFYQGGLMSALHAIFAFRTVAGCDPRLIQKERDLEVCLPNQARICWAETESSAYRRFRHELGKIDLVFIDADHGYHAVRKDYERERGQPHRFLAFHDIKNEAKAPGVVRLWRELGGKKREIFESGPSAKPMGIGIWSQKETP